MTSRFGQNVHETRHNLTVQLIEKLLGVQPEDENYSLALDFCLQKEYYHSFADVSPRDVESFYLSIIKRLHEDSQLSKASALSALTTKFLSYNLTSVSPEINHNLLQLLASLTGQPLDSVLEVTPQLLAAVYQPAEDAHQSAAQQHRAAVQRFRQLAAGGHDTDTSGYSDTAGSDYDPFGEESDLTSWDSNGDDDDDCGSKQPPTSHAGPTTAQQQQEATAVVSGTSSDVEQAPKHVYTCCIPVPALHPPQQLRPGLTMPQPTELLAKLAASRVDQLPLMRPDPDYCFTTPYLAQQLLRLLQGHQAHGFVLAASTQTAWGHIHAATASGAATGGVGGSRQQHLVPDPRVTSPGLSPAALHAMLQKFAACGTKACQLRRLSQQLTQHRGKEWRTDRSAGGSSTAAGEYVGAGGMAVTPCLRAFGVALLQQLDMMGQQLAQLQQGETVQPTGTAGGESAEQRPALSLCQVEQLARPIIQRIALLHDTVFGVIQQLGGPAANVSAALLDGLYEKASAAAVLSGGAQGTAHAAALLHLLLCSCVPMVTALEQWLWSADDGLAADSLADDGTTSSYSHYRRGQQDQQQQLQHDEVSVCCEDFFTVRKSGVAATDARFWHAAYGFSESLSSAEAQSNGGTLQPTGAQSMTGCPSFLLRLAGGIMTAGKGVRLLDYMEQEELRHSTFLAARVPAAAWGAAAMRRSDTSMRAFRPQSSSGRAARFTSAGGVSSRRRWGDAAGARVTSSTTAAPSDLIKQVRLQLAMAAVEARQRQQQQLASDFIHTISGLLQRSRVLLQQEQTWPPAGVAAALEQHHQQQVKPGSTADVMRSALHAVAAQLAQPYGSYDRHWASGQRQQTVGLQPPVVGLRQALLQAKARRCAQEITGSSQNGRQQQRQQPAQALQSTGPAPAEQQAEVVLQQGHADPDHADDEHMQVAQATAAVTAQAGGATDGISVTPGSEAAHADAVPRLLQWRQQMQAKLSAAGGCLQQLAPWQQRQQQHSQQIYGSSRTVPAAQSAAEGFQVLGCCSKVPGSFSGSLAELWPLKPSAAALKQCSQRGTSETQQHSDGGLQWRAGGAWPCERLSWLLTHPPQQVVSLSELLEQALLQPLQARVDLVGRQLLSSLMGEWGLMQQLQGLVGAFLIASPAMVEWTEACFKAVEAAQSRPKPSASSSTIGPGPRPGSAGGPGTTAAAAAHSGAAKTEQTAVGPEELDVVELEVLLQDLAAGVDVDDPLPDPSCLHLTLNTAALADIRARAAQHTQQTQPKPQHKTQQQTDSDTTTPAASSAATRGAGLTATVTGGLWRCVSEWAGLSCRHSGTWQLSLLYDTQELNKFSMAWRFLLQLRWVRRRVDAARHAACKGSSSIISMSPRDEAEQAAVAAAQRSSNQSSSRGLWYNSDVVNSGAQWLSSREELLLLQEMGQLLARWQQHLMDRIIRKDWVRLEQALCNASSLDEVRAAAALFLRTIRDLCNAQSSNQGWKTICAMLLKLMDTVLDAAAATAKFTELRQLLAQADSLPTAAATKKAWLELGAARTRLASAEVVWRQQCDLLFRTFNHRSSSAGEAEESVLEALDMNGYFRTVAHAWNK